MRFLQAFVALITLFGPYTAFSAEWLLDAKQTIENDDGTVTIVRPFREGPIDEPTCGGMGTVDFGHSTNKDKLCREFGYVSHVKGSVRYFEGAVLMSRVLADKRRSGGWWCMGAPVGTQWGIQSFKCR